MSQTVEGWLGQLLLSIRNRRQNPIVDVILNVFVNIPTALYGGKFELLYT